MFYIVVRCSKVFMLGLCGMVFSGFQKKINILIFFFEIDVLICWLFFIGLFNIVLMFMLVVWEIKLLVVFVVYSMCCFSNG